MVSGVGGEEKKIENKQAQEKMACLLEEAEVKQNKLTFWSYVPLYEITLNLSFTAITL